MASKRVWLTIYEGGEPLAEGFTALVSDYAGRPAEQGEEKGETLCRLELLGLAVESLGYEVSFSEEKPVLMLASEEYVSVEKGKER